MFTFFVEHGSLQCFHITSVEPIMSDMNKVLMALDLEFSVAAGVTTAILLLILSYKLLLQSFLYWNKRGVPQVGALEVNTRFKDALLSRIHISQVFAFIYKDLEDHDFGGFYKLFSPCLMIRDPKVIKTILVKEFDSFHDNESQVKLESDVLAGGSPFFCSGDKAPGLIENIEEYHIFATRVLCTSSQHIQL
uniref:Uncharacterized protein n=1 Tax=Timema monikensis TaxID=170555 RepID=A0A7R9EF42_9NEOP|nr:unnamed protein product [Timema monikensis]